MYAPYRNYDAALGAASAVPGSPTMVNVPLADVREQLSRLGLDPAAVATSLNAAFKMSGLQELSPTFSVGDASVQMPAVVWARLMGTVSPILPATMVDAPWTVQYRWPLILGLGAIGLLAAYKLLWKPSRQVRMARNKRSVRRNKGQELILDGYVFEYEGAGSGSLDELAAAIRAPDDDWEIVMVSHLKAHATGSKRKIDDSSVTIFQGSDGRLYAAQPSALRTVTANSHRKQRMSIPRVGTRVIFEPYPPSLAMYSHPPRTGEEGTVSTVSFGSSNRHYLPGPGGGLLYVDWDESAFQGVSLLDIQVLHRGKQKNWGGRFKKGGGR